MGAFWLLSLLGVGLIVALSGENGDYFFVVAPNMMRFEHPETVMVSVFGKQRRVKIWLSHKNHEFSRHGLTVNQVTPTTVTMQVRETDLKLEELESKPRTIKLIAECDGIRREKEILLQYSSGYIFVQTSQPVYSPRDIVKIRCLALSESMQKIGENVNVSMDIINPKHRVVLRVHKTTRDAFYRYDFGMPTNLDSGIWAIKVFYRGMYQTEAKAFFEVRKYVVPTFGVDVDVSTHTVLPDSHEHITATVTAKYVYGKPVDGWVDIRVYLKENGGQTELLAFPQKSFNAEGKAQFKIDIEMLRRELRSKNKLFPDGGTRLKVLATAVEGATLKKEIGMNERVLFSEVPLIFRFTRSRKYFRLLRKYYLKLDVTFPNGQAAIEKHVKARKQVNGILLEQQEGITDENGQITFTFGTYGERMIFKANDIEGKSTSDSFVVESYRGDNQISAEHIIKDGENQIRASNNMRDGSHTAFISMIIARGKILDARYGRPDNNVSTVLTPEIQDQISPSGRYIIFYCDLRTNEVVADSIKISIPSKCKDRKMLKLDTERHILPGVHKLLRVTGQPGTDIGLSVIDKAVLLLNNNNILHKDKLFKEMDLHDIGCGNGGGRNSAEVFNNAGLTVITDANMITNSRETTYCEEGARRKRSTDDKTSTVSREKEYQMDLAAIALDEESLYVRKNFKESFLFEDFHLGAKVRLCPSKNASAKTNQSLEPSAYENLESLEIKAVAPELLDLLPLLLPNIQYDRNDNPPEERVSFTDQLHLYFSANSGSGEMAVRVRYPDSITEWMIQTISLTPGNGVCISEPLNVTAFRDFFIQLDLPYQAVRMEHLEVKASVFVYGTPGGSNSSVSVYMDGVDGLCSNVKPERKSDRIEFEMTPNSAHTVRYPIIPMYAPKKYPIKVTAIKKQFGIGQADTIGKILSVVNEGKENLIELVSCLDPMEQLRQCLHSERIKFWYGCGVVPTQFIMIDLTLPEHIKGTGQGIVNIKSHIAMEDDIQAVYIQGVESWIKLPTGDVEQTIVELGPLVYAMKYLKLTNRVTEIIEQDGYDHVRKGVLREYSFKKEDHSYPPFAQKGSSTWLTAFVTKVFCEANKVVDGSLEVSVHVIPTVNWLTTHQNADGSFTEHNFVNHLHHMSFSKSSHPGLTAFILIAMQECRISSTNVENAVQKALRFLENQPLDTLREDPYSLALITYALALSNSTWKMTFYEELKTIAGRREGMMYWAWPGNGQVQPQHIEATSYALLAQLQLVDDLRSSSETVKWLLQHRSSGETFQTTQDTVIGLQALSEYNIRADVNLFVKLMGDKNDEIIISTPFAQNFPVEVGGKLYVKVTGKGTGTLRLGLKYNIEKTNAEKCPFVIKIEVKSESGLVCGWSKKSNDAAAFAAAFGETEFSELGTNFGRSKNYRIRPELHCATVEVKSLIETDGMVTVEIGLETGMTVLQMDLEKLKDEGNIRMYEMPTCGKGFFVLYVDKMLKSKTYRFSFTLKGTAEYGVFHRQAAYVKVIDYYNPGSRCKEFYGTGSNNYPAFITKCSDDDCLCLKNLCPVSWKGKLKSKFQERKGNRKKQGPAEFLVERTCANGYGVLVKIVSVGNRNEDQKEKSVEADVQAIYKKGRETLRVGSRMTLIWHMECVWPDLKEGEKYYVIAKEGLPYKNGNETQYKYYISDEDIILEQEPRHTLVRRIMTVYERFWKWSRCPGISEGDYNSNHLK